jgi:hypothetical protein
MFHAIVGGLIHNLIKYAQHNDVFALKFLDVVKDCEMELYHLDIDPYFSLMIISF